MRMEQTPPADGEGGEAANGKQRWGMQGGGVRCVSTGRQGWGCEAGDERQGTHWVGERNMVHAWTGKATGGWRRATNPVVWGWLAGWLAGWRGCRALTQGLHGPEGPDAASHAKATGDNVRQQAAQGASKQVGQAKHSAQHASGVQIHVELQAGRKAGAGGGEVRKTDRQET